MKGGKETATQVPSLPAPEVGKGEREFETIVEGLADPIEQWLTFSEQAEAKRPERD